MSIHRIVLDVPETTQQFQDRLQMGSEPKIAAVSIGNYFQAMAGGVRLGTVSALVGAVQATGAVTFTGLPSNNETMSVCGVTLTAVSGTPTGNQFQIGADATATATNLRNLINSQSTLNKIVVATSNAGVVTLTCLVPGVIGNGLQLSESLSNATITAFASGAEGTAYTLDLD